MNTKEKILVTALRLFAVYGYEAVSVSQIAGELGITKGALYKHYKNMITKGKREKEISKLIKKMPMKQ